MRYLVTSTSYEPFLTDYFMPENNFNKDADMVVYDLENETYMTDGVSWQIIKEDHL